MKKTRSTYEDRIRNIMLRHINTFNSFVDNQGKNRFSNCVSELTQLFKETRVNKRKKVKLYTTLEGTGLEKTIFDDSGKDDRFSD